MSAFKGGVKTGSLVFSLEKRFPADFPEMMARAEKYARAEEAMKARRESAKGPDRDHKNRRRDQPRRSRSRSPRRGSPPPRAPRRPYSPPRKFEHYTPLVKPQAQILMEIDGRGFLKAPAPMRTNYKRDKNKYCRYHKDIGHNIEDCRQLRDEIEALIRRGHLSHYARPQPVPQEVQQEPPPPNENRPTAGVINTILGGTAKAYRSADSPSDEDR